MAGATTHIPNISHLAVHAEQLGRLGALAEHYFSGDPSTCLLKLCQFGELMAQHIAAPFPIRGESARTNLGFSRTSGSGMYVLWHLAASLLPTLDVSLQVNKDEGIAMRFAYQFFSQAKRRSSVSDLVRTSPITIWEKGRARGLSVN